MESISFRYQKPDGEVCVRTLTDWKEDGRYLKGFDAHSGAVRTFRKDRVAEYLDAADAALLDPYPLPPPKLEPARERDKRPQILFTGFAAKQREELEAQSDASGLHVVKTVTHALAFLCAGPNAGPVKVAKARSQGVYVLHEQDMAAFLESGELPDRALE